MGNTKGVTYVVAMLIHPGHLISPIWWGIGYSKSVVFVLSFMNWSLVHVMQIELSKFGNNVFCVNLFTFFLWCAFIAKQTEIFFSLLKAIKLPLIAFIVIIWTFVYICFIDIHNKSPYSHNDHNFLVNYYQIWTLNSRNGQRW